MGNPFHTEDMADIAAICGDDIALELMTKLPGVEVKVPLHWSADNPLSRLSREAADVIIRDLAGNKFYIPTRTDRVDNKAAVLRLYREGKTALDIALELRISERYVRMIMSGKCLPKQRKVDERQIDLEDFLSMPE